MLNAVETLLINDTDKLLYENVTHPFPLKCLQPTAKLGQPLNAVNKFTNNDIDKLFSEKIVCLSYLIFEFLWMRVADVPVDHLKHKTINFNIKMHPTLSSYCAKYEIKMQHN